MEQSNYWHGGLSVVLHDTFIHEIVGSILMDTIKLFSSPIFLVIFLYFHIFCSVFIKNKKQSLTNWQENSFPFTKIFFNLLNS